MLLPRERRPAVLKLRRVVLILVVLAVALLIWSPWRSLFRYHFNFLLPASAKIVNYHHSPGFLDSGDEFEFAVTDDALRDAIIQEWNLKRSDRDEDVRSWAVGTGAKWWPRDRVNKCSERYGRVDQTAHRYWSLWVDRENGRLYAEYGDW